MVGELAAVGSALGVLKSLTEIAKNANSIELTQKIIELQKFILDMQTGMTELTEENRTLKQRLEEQQRLQVLAEDMEYVEDGGFYVKKSERAQGRDIAYCPLCWKAAPRTDVPLNPKSGEGYFFCKIHETVFETAAYRALREERSRPARTWREPSGPDGWMR